MVEVSTFGLFPGASIADTAVFFHASKIGYSLELASAVSGPKILVTSERSTFGPIIAKTNAVAPSALVPVPAGLALILTGIAGLGLVARRGSRPATD